MEFYNFGNQQTFHFFKWLTSARRIASLDLVQQALTRVEKNEWYEMGMDVSFAARQELVAILNELLSEEVAQWSEDHDIPLSLIPDGGVDAFAESGDYNSEHALFIPLIEGAVGSIDTFAVAQALLIRAGKWAPDRTRPEIE